MTLYRTSTASASDSQRQSLAGKLNPLFSSFDSLLFPRCGKVLFTYLETYTAAGLKDFDCFSVFACYS